MRTIVVSAWSVMFITGRLIRDRPNRTIDLRVVRQRLNQHLTQRVRQPGQLPKNQTVDASSTAPRTGSQMSIVFGAPSASVPVTVSAAEITRRRASQIAVDHSADRDMTITSGSPDCTSPSAVVMNEHECLYADVIAAEAQGRKRFASRMPASSNGSLLTARRHKPLKYRPLSKR